MLCSCGGGAGGGGASAYAGGSANPSAPDTEAPVLVVQSAWDGVTSGTMDLWVTSATDNYEVTGYCLGNSGAQPRAADACFGDTKAWTVPIGPAWQVWARDAAGNVSVAAADGPCSAAAKSASSGSLLPTVCIRTDLGEIVLELELAKAFATVQNFRRYVGEGFYGATVFHRVLPGSVLQGGGFSSLADVATYTAKPTYSPIALQATNVTGLSNVQATIAMARTSDVNSATSQFFINLRDNASSYDFDASRTSGAVDGYAVFGRVIFGYNTVAAIAATPLVGDLPQNPTYIQWAYLMK